MSNDVPEIVEAALDHGDRTDVSEEYAETIDMLIDIAHSRTNPIPIKHAIAFDDTRNESIVTLLFVVDTTGAVENGMAFELPVESEVLDPVESGEFDQDGRVERPHHQLIEEFGRRIRYVEEELWSNVINAVDGER